MKYSELQAAAAASLERGDSYPGSLIYAYGMGDDQGSHVLVRVGGQWLRLGTCAPGHGATYRVWVRPLGPGRDEGAMADIIQELYT